MEDVLAKVRKLRFSYRDKFFKELTELGNAKANTHTFECVKIAWPEMLLFLDAHDFERALNKVMEAEG